MYKEQLIQSQHSHIVSLVKTHQDIIIPSSCAIIIGQCWA